MQNKLQELTDKLYNEGLSKGKAEGEQILADARNRAEEILAKAKAEADEILAEAAKKASDLEEKTSSDVKMASAQCLQATRSDIENLVCGKIVAPKVEKALSEEGFVKEIIKAVASRFSASESADLALVLPESLKESLEPWVAGELSKELGSEIKASFSKKIGGGFTIGPKDGSYYVSLSEQTFKELIAEYLRPVTRKLLFGE